MPGGVVTPDVHLRGRQPNSCIGYVRSALFEVRELALTEVGMLREDKYLFIKNRYNYELFIEVMVTKL